MESAKQTFIAHVLRVSGVFKCQSKHADATAGASIGMTNYSPQLGVVRGTILYVGTPFISLKRVKLDN